ncbi:MAG TPA: divalent metal cation transporter [Micropepsaceae bacterium]|nr:divalent metal cation transporter [Micropepsaceae bacterium]
MSTASQTRRHALKAPNLRGLIRKLGPGVITGAADDDPSGIATYSQVGAQFGYSLGWTVVLTTPLMAAVQEIAARIGRVTGAGLGAALGKHTPAWFAKSVVVALIAANVLNLGADLGGMAEACRLLVGGPQQVYAIAIAIFCAACEVYLAYRRYVLILKWLTLSLFAYVALLFVVELPVDEVIKGALVPNIALGGSALTSLLAVLGTTISPYLFFWQASEEVEEEQEQTDPRPLKEHPRDAGKEFAEIRFDTYLGMIFSNLIAFAIIIGTAATLHANGVTKIATAADAAMALKPIAGSAASVIFALGIVGTGLLAVPVLAGSAAYALGEVLAWPVGLGRRAFEARAFYATISMATLIGVVIVFSPLDPIKALFMSAVVNGAVSGPIIGAMVVLGSRERVMGKLVLPKSLQVLGWMTAFLMGAATVAMVVL